MAEPEVLETLKQSVQEGLQEGFSSLEAKIDQKIAAAVKPISDRLETVVRYDAEGKKFRWAGGEAPAILKGAVNQSSKPLMISNLWRAVMMGAGHRGALLEFAGEELAMTERLRQAGYQALYLGSALFPLAEELLVEPVDEHGRKLADFSALKAEIAERLHIKFDQGELGWLVKRFPEFAMAPASRGGLGLQQKDLQLGDDTLGGYLIPTTQADRVIDLLRNRLSVMRAGAQEVPLPPSGNISYPRLTSDPTFTWTDPDTTTDASTSNIGLGVVRLQAKSLRGFVTIPNDLLRYASPSVEMLVRSALAAKFAVAEDSAYLEGAGSSLEPKGVINYPVSTAETPTVGRITLHVASTAGTNGDTFEPEDVMKIMALYYAGNDPDPPTAWILRPLLWAAIANRRADAVTSGDQKGPFMFWTSRGGLGDQVPQSLGGIQVVQTVQASANRVKGSGTTLVYALFGNFRRLIIGRVGVLELAVSEHVKFLQDKTIIRAVGRSDSGLEHEESLVFTDSLLES
jgi:HK97 family phage major capsid protein